MARTTVTLETRDGRCDTSIFRPARPAGSGPWPAVIVYMDGVGIRPALFELCERIAAAGYVVALPDLFYRAGPYEPVDAKKLFTDPETLATWRAKFMSSVTQEKTMSDTSALLDYLAAQADVKQPKVGVVGYCMGGGMALAAAGFYPERVAAAASFHGARLATDAPDSPHLLAPKMKAKVYVAGAVDDPDEMKRKLDTALRAAGVDHTVVTYEGARHGWVPSDTPVHDPEAAERHFEALFKVLGEGLA